ncbi:hypothetical protein VKT23_015720 [Stygiomarasmius scandens]|uniref:Heterokaryon incompatibility domain-containing protein n=1 Tax=Marasmiellus scandens TaxID=2682957 RepID=A0ABR1IXC9_9AGAR
MLALAPPPRTRPNRTPRPSEYEKGKRKAMKNPSSPALMAATDICPHRFIDTRTLGLVEFDEDSFIPPYAMFSHTWSKGNEVVYDEFIHPQAETFSKLGYHKIRDACRQARRDGIRYIWVDTCCVKQGNHEDVVANITSMYAYYQNAEVCYVYLVDAKDTSRRDMFGERGAYYWWGGSLWFRRGWTLQELLAPQTVVFFNKRWRQIGNKHELRGDIHQRTTIPITVLSGEQSIQDVDVFTRISWAMDRETTRGQDQAYCLQGLLGITVVPSYVISRYASFDLLSQVLSDAYPELEKRLGIRHNLFSDLNGGRLYLLLSERCRRRT